MHKWTKSWAVAKAVAVTTVVIVLPGSSILLAVYLIRKYWKAHHGRLQQVHRTNDDTDVRSQE